jgi:alkylation response protein AidB-like acyl-CoA dehydrogenase
MTDLLYTEDEEQLRGTLRDALTRRAPASTVLARLESGEPYDRELWRILATEIGLAGIGIPERFGGAGASLRESAVVLEELGRSVAPVPFLTSAVVATRALVESAPSSQAAVDVLTKMAAGSSVAALVLPYSAHVPSALPVGDRLTGRVTTVAGALGADVLLVPAGDGLYAVDAAAEGVHIEPVASLDLTRPLANVTLDGAAGRLVADGSVAGRAVTTALRAGAALLASEQLGLAGWCLDSTVEYVKVRHQFGRPIGGFQALKHRLADVWVDVTQARAVARYAASCAATDDPDLAVAASLAKAFCSPVAVKAAEECVQLHGGIGFTWEHPAHLYLKRAKSSALAYGTAEAHRAILGDLVDLP